MKGAESEKLDDEVSYLMEQVHFEQQDCNIPRNVNKSALYRETTAGQQSASSSSLNRTMAERYQETSAVQLQLKDYTIYMLVKQLEDSYNENSNIFDKYQSVYALNYRLEYEITSLKKQNERTDRLEQISADYYKLYDENSEIRDKAARVVYIVVQQQEELAELKNNTSGQLKLKKYQGLIERLQTENYRYKEIFDSLAIATYADYISKQQQYTRQLEASTTELYARIEQLGREHTEEISQMRNERNSELERLRTLHADELTIYLSRLKEDMASAGNYLAEQVNYLYTQLSEERKSHERDSKLFLVTKYYLCDLQQSSTYQQVKSYTAISKAKLRYNSLADYLEEVLQLNNEQKREIDALQIYNYELKLKLIEYQAEIGSLKQINSNLSCGSFGVLNQDVEIKRILDEIQEQSRAEVRRILAEVGSSAAVELHYPKIPAFTAGQAVYNSEEQGALSDEVEQGRDDSKPET